MVKGFILLFLTCILFLTRANALLTFLPAILFLLLSDKGSVNKKVSLAISVATVLMAAISLNAILPGGLLRTISVRQKEFQLLDGGSRIFLPVLESTAQSVAEIFPVASFNGFFQPLPGQGGKAIYTAFSVELFFIWAIILPGCLLIARKKTIRFSNFEIACLLFAVPGLIVIGYMIPFARCNNQVPEYFFTFFTGSFFTGVVQISFKPATKINAWLHNNAMVEKPASTI